MSRSDPSRRWGGRSLSSSGRIIGLGLATVLAAAGGAVPAQAAGLVEESTTGAYDRGSYTRIGYQDGHESYAHDPNITYFTAGRTDNTVNSNPLWQVDRNFFVFDLQPTEATVSKAELVLKFNGAAYESEDASETYSLFDVSTDPDTLVAGGDGTPGLGAIWDDLGSGHRYGSRTFTAADQGTIVRIPLDATARLQAAAGGKFAIGGAITSLSSRPAGTENRFWYQMLFILSAPDFVSLDLTFSGSQPDGWLKGGTGSGVGYGVTNHTAKGQVLTQWARPGTTATFTLTIWNAVGINDRYRIQADGSVKGYRVKYLWGGDDITAEVVAGTYRSPIIDPATSGDLTIKVTVLASAKVGSSVARAITVRSVGDNRADVVKAVVKRR